MQKYFAAANTADGFVSWFDDIFTPDSDLYTYIIKGGSGTGKSTLMKTAAELSEKSGGKVEYFYCSSDTSSLDGIIVTTKDGKRRGMLDGTAPHTRDPKYPGVCDEIINLGNYWDKGILGASHERVIKLSKEKSALFSAAYGDFRAAGTLLKSLIDNARRLTDEDKLYSASLRLLLRHMRELKFKPVKGIGIRRIRGLSALSTDGRVSFNSFCGSEQIYHVTDTLFSTPLAFESLIRAANTLGLSYDRAPMCLLPCYTEAIRFPELSVSVLSEAHGRDFPPINMSRFVDRGALSVGERKHTREVSKASHTLISSGISKLEKVKSVHGELERIYGSAMNFQALSADSEEIISEFLK